MGNPFARRADPAPPGFHGKSPALGDFVSRRVPPGFLPVWDDWLQRLMVASRAALGEGWRAAWLRAPVWHFALGAGVAGAARGWGVLIPSVDRVGRDFPFTVLGLEAAGGVALADWTRRAEALALGALDDGFDPEALDAALRALGPPAAGAADWPGGAGPSPGQTLWWSQGEATRHSTGLPGPALATELVLGEPGAPPL